MRITTKFGLDVGDRPLACARDRQMPDGQTLRARIHAAVALRSVDLRKGLHRKRLHRTMEPTGPFMILLLRSDKLVSTSLDATEKE
jgi:hypothetical protein